MLCVKTAVQTTMPLNILIPESVDRLISKSISWLVRFLVSDMWMRFLSAAVPEAHDRNLRCPSWHATRRQLSVSVACAQGSSQWPTDRYGSSLFGRHPCLSKTRHEHEANLEQDASSLSLRSCLSRIASRRDATWLPRPLLLIHTRREPAPPSGQHKNEQTPATQPEKYSVSHKSKAI